MAHKRKARFAKGSAAAKAWGKKMAKARKECDSAYAKTGKKHPKPKHKKASKHKAARKAHPTKAHPKKAKAHPKKRRTAAQKAATAKMLAANKAKRRGEHKPKHKKAAKKSHPKSHASRKAKRQAAVLGAFRGGPRGGVVVEPHRGSMRCSICGIRHGLREHHSHAHGPHNLRTATEHSYKGLSTPETIAANPKAPVRVKPPKTLKEAAAIAALERKSGKKAVFIEPKAGRLTKKRVREFYKGLEHTPKGKMFGPHESRAAKKARKAWQAFRYEAHVKKTPGFVGPRRISGSIH